jgi:hypothetical protein
MESCVRHMQETMAAACDCCCSCCSMHRISAHARHTCVSTASISSQIWHRLCRNWCLHELRGERVLACTGVPPRPEKVKQSVTMVSFQHCICNNARHSFVLEIEPEHFHVVSWNERASDHVEKSCWVRSTRGEVSEGRGEEGQGLRSIPLNCLPVHLSIHPSSRYSYLGRVVSVRDFRDSCDTNLPLPIPRLVFSTNGR